jgi:hypothetical protein
MGDKEKNLCKLCAKFGFLITKHDPKAEYGLIMMRPANGRTKGDIHMVDQECTAVPLGRDVTFVKLGKITISYVASWERRDDGTWEWCMDLDID